MFSASTEIIVLDDFKEGFWGGRVPAPGTTWTVEEIVAWVNYAQNLTEEYRECRELIGDPKRGIAATTARHRKEQG